MKSFDQAIIDKKRIFKCSYSDTIRTCPENYLVAFKFDDEWVARGDKAIQKYWARFQGIVETYNNDTDIIEDMNQIAPKDHAYEAWQ